MPDRQHELVSVREYIEALLTEHQRATETAERERGKAAEALSAEKRAAAQTAEREREKAADTLAEQLTRQITQGDGALRDHIEQQIQQLRIMLESTRRESDIRSTEQEKAILKAEGADDKRFAGVNALREQMGDLIASHQKTLGDLTATLMPREVAETRMDDLRARIDVNRDSINGAVPREELTRLTEELTAWRSRVDSLLVGVAASTEVRREVAAKHDVKMTGWQLALAGTAVTTFMTIVTVVANFLTGH